MRSRALSFVLALGCADDEYVVVWSGEHLELATAPKHADRLCAGTGPFLESASVAIADRLRLPTRHIRYVWLPDGAAATPCPASAGGCADGDVAYAPAPWVEHELVHVHTLALGRTDPFLEEGLAEYLGGMSGVPATGDASTFTGHQRRIWDPQFYPTAGRWIAEAVAATSMDAVMDLYRASDFEDGPDAFEVRTTQNLGVDMRDLVDSIRTAPTCSALAYREDTTACAGDPLPWIGDRWTLDRQADCEDESIFGYRDDMRFHATVELDGETTINVVADDGDAFLITDCAARCDGGDVIRLQRGDELDLLLAAGRYVVEARQTSDGRFSLTMRR